MSQPLPTSRGPVQVREAKPGDAAAFRELRLDALQDSPIAFTFDYERALSQPASHWEDMLKMHSDESAIFLAWHENELIGMTGIARGTSPKTRHGATVWGVYVKPAWRGLHIAEGLVNYSLDWAKARKIVIAKLGVAVVNTSAIRCYHRCGFQIYAREPLALLYGGIYYDFYWMSCSLDGS